MKKTAAGEAPDKTGAMIYSTTAGRKPLSIVVQRSFPGPLSLSYSHKCPSPESDKSAKQQVHTLFHGKLAVACHNQLLHMQS